MPKRIIVEIDAKGERTFITEGFEGDECLRETEIFKQALGGTTEEPQLAHEYFTKDRERIAVLRAGN